MTIKWSVPRMWDGETCAILASGPSMTREQAEVLRGRCKVIAVNNTGIPTEIDGVLRPAMAEWADILYASDSKWWVCYQDRALKFQGLKVCLRPNLPFSDVYALEQSREQVFDKRQTHLATGGNSGYAALHLAVHLGVKRVLLVGFDMRDAAGKRRHYFGNHPPRLNSQNAYATWVRAYTRFAPLLQKMGVEVLNCTQKGALHCFRRMTLQEAIGVSSGQTSTQGEFREADHSARSGDGHLAHDLVEVAH